MSNKRPTPPTRVQEGYQPKLGAGYQPEGTTIDISLLKPPTGGSAVQPPTSSAAATPPPKPSGGDNSK